MNRSLFKSPQTEAFSNTTQDTYLKQIQKLDVIENNYVDLSNNIDVYNAEYDIMTTDPKYQDFKGDFLQHLDKSTTVQDALKEDIETAIIQRNNSYIVGMITIGTVILTSYIILKKF